MKKTAALFVCSAVIAASFTMPAAVVGAESDDKGIVILHTNDVHCGFETDDETLGAAELAAYKARLESEGFSVILADAGDFVQGGVIGTLSDGEYPMQIMNALGYDVAVPGNHEFDYGMDNFFKLVDEANFPYLSANFTDLRTGEKPLDGYEIVETDGVKIGFVGITTPETPLSTRPIFFQDENGENIYGFCGESGEEFYSEVQTAVDGAVSDGADYIVILGHMGDYVYDGRWSSEAVIENVSGIDVFIDGHSHSVIENKIITDKDGSGVVLASTGTKLRNIGAVTIRPDGITSELIGKADIVLSEDENSAEYKAYEDMNGLLAEIGREYNELAGTVVAVSEVELTVNDPETGERAVRSAETNMGDLCADAYRAETGADAAVINGGGVRSGIAAGDITYGNIVDVQPFGNSLCAAEVTGQQILDCLEMGARYYPEENGGFIQVSGITYEIHSYIPSSVITDENGFVGVGGEYRVKNVCVNGEPLDLNKKYTLASHNYYLLSCGDGMTMFKDSKIIAREMLLDNQALIEYMTDTLGGTVGGEYSDPHGSGRITVIAEAPTAEYKPSPDTGAESVSVFIAVMGLSAALMIASRKRK